MEIQKIAQVCHETNRAYCQTIGDNSQKPWSEAEEWQRKSAIAGVRVAIDHPEFPPSYQHEAWTADKFQDGWKYGPDKDPVKKEHPCLVPYDQLPVEQRLKDYLFKAVVSAFVEAEKE